MLADTCEAAVGYLLYFPWPAAILQHNIFKNIFKLLYLTQEKYIFEENYSYGCSAHPQRRITFMLTPHNWIHTRKS